MAVKKTKTKKSLASSAAAMSPVRMERALASGCFEGFTPTVAKKLVAAFGSGVPEAIERWHPDAKRILGNRWDAAGDEMVEHGSALPMASWLLEQGFSGAMARKAMIWQLHESEWKHPDMALAAWRENPYGLAKIPGITFERADKIALALGFPAQGEARIMACAQEALRLSCDKAGGGAALSDVEAQARKLLALNNAVSMRECASMAPAAIVAAAAKGFAKAAIDENGVQMMFAADLYEAEEKSAHMLLKMVGQPSPLRFEGLAQRIQELEKQTGLTLHDEQRHALKVIFEGKISIICGKPGSGKTTLLKCAAPLLESGGRKILYACPTGKAAKRMSKALDRRATTLHRLLSIGRDDEGGSGRVATSIKDADAVVIDESSMLDSKMFLRLLTAIGPNTSIILLGDPKQLPSVGAGKVLSDLIESKQIPTAIMNKIVRQKEGSSIKEVARSLGDGVWMDFDDKQSDCMLLEEPDESRVAPRIAKMLERASLAGHDPLKDAQVLSAGNAGESGVKALNIALQALLNPAGSGKAEAQIREDLLLRVGDKVMQTSNDYERELMPAMPAAAAASIEESAWDEPEAKAPQGPAQAAPRIKMERPLEGFDEDPEPSRGHNGLDAPGGEVKKGVFNGDVGYVLSITRSVLGDKIRIQFDDGIAEYDYKEASSSIVLAYACTVHKFQGSEAPLIFFVMHDNTSQMLRNRNSVYTAITRASLKCISMGSKRAFKDAIKRDALTRRRTRLKGLLDGSIAVDHSASAEVLALSEKQGFERLIHDAAADLRLAQPESAWDEPADAAAPPAPKRRANAL